MARRQFSWTAKQIDKLNKVLEILEELQEYKPLTLRQVYYQLIGKGYMENRVSEYNMLSTLVKHGRIDGYINWKDIEDRTRTYNDLTGWSNADRFIKASFNHFLEGYQRNLLQSQEKYIEVWIEKDALSSIFNKVASIYTVPVVTCRGFSSVSFLNDFKNRLTYQKVKKPIMLYFGDFDPSGLEMLDSMQVTFENELNVTGVDYKRIALTKQDIFDFELPHDPNALKESDTRLKKFKEKYGTYAVELDALRPNILEQKIRDAIENEVDMRTFEKEMQIMESEFEKLDTFKSRVSGVLNDY
jgi:hypothetical protein